MWVFDPKKFRAIRKRKHLSKQDLADLLAERIKTASKQLIDQWEVYGRMPHGSYLVEICEIMEIDLKQIMSESSANTIKAAWKRTTSLKKEVLDRDPMEGHAGRKKRKK